MEPNILVVDYEPIDIEQIEKVLVEIGYHYTLVNSGAEALKKLEKEKFNVLITELDLPNMSSEELIRKANNLFGTIGIYMSDDSDPDKIIQRIGRFKAFDYILKPINKENLRSSIDSAVAAYEHNLRISTFTESEKQFYNTIINIFDWKKELQQSQVESLTGNMIRQMNKNLFQDSGFAVLFNTLNMFFSKAKFNQQKNSYEITKNLYLLIKENFAQADKMVRTIAESQKILTRIEPFAEECEIADFVHVLDAAYNELSRMILIKSQQVFLGRIPELGRNKKVILDKDKMKSVLKELMINAMKYSAERDVIIVLFFINNNYLEIKVLNPARKNQEGKEGISGNDERMVFEPFFRLTSEVDDRYVDEEFGYGLGLTVVKKIVELHNSNILIHTIQNNVNEKSESEVVVTISMPII